MSDARLDTDAVVIGAGAAGLAAAAALDARDLDVLVLEGSERVGGALWTEDVGDFRVERGASSMRVTAPALDVIQRAGAEPFLERAAPESRARFLVRGGELVRVPMDPISLALGSRHLSARARIGMLGEPFRRRGDPAGESVADFISRRLGPEVTERLVAPFLIGIYSARPEELGVEAVFPSLVAHEREGGSITWGALRNALRNLIGGAPAGLAGTWSTSEGLGGLAERIARSLPAPVRTRTHVMGLARDGECWRVEAQGPAGSQEFVAGRVVVATEAAGAATLLHGLDAEAARLCRSIRYGPLASVALVVDPSRANVDLEGFGFLVPDEEELDLLGMLFMSRLFAGRAPEGRVLTTAMIGGARWPEVADASDSDITSRVYQGIERILGVTGGAEPLCITRWARAVPWPAVGHPALISNLRNRLAAHPGLALAGGWLDGVGVSHALSSGRAAGSSV